MVDYLLKDGKRSNRGFWSAAAVFRLDKGKEQSRPWAFPILCKRWHGLPFSFTLRELVPAAVTLPGQAAWRQKIRSLMKE
jgi:hypothetical protein